jgi:hypothetical protein
LNSNAGTFSSNLEHLTLSGRSTRGKESGIPEGLVYRPSPLKNIGSYDRPKDAFDEQDSVAALPMRSEIENEIETILALW